MRIMPKRRLAALVALLAAALLTAGCGWSKPPPATSSELHIAAAVSLKEALAEAGSLFTARHPNVKIIYNLGASGALQRQIEQGAPADVFIAAAARQMDELAAKNLLVPGTRRDIAANRLVLVVPKDSPLPVAGFADLAGDKVRKIALGETATVPAGQYAREALENLGLWDRLKDKYVFAKDARTVLAYVVTGNVDAGLVYATDAAGAGVKVVAAAPAASHRPIVYPAAVVAASPRPALAADFLAFLAGREGQAVLARHGFETKR